MRKFIWHFPFLFLIFFASNAFAQRNALPDNTYVYDNLIVSIPGTGAPFVKDGYVVFTAEQGARNIGIAFDFENYSVIHPFEIRKTRDMDENVTGNLFFYALAIPAHTLEISYRLVMDGMWTADPLNPDSYYDAKTGIKISHVFIADSFNQETEIRGKNVRFVYHGKPNQTVKLTGTFTNWDPWIYELTETKPGFYEIDIALREGTYYYNYMIGMTPLLDSTNPNKAYTAEGRRSSVLVIN